MSDKDAFRIMSRETAERALFLIFCACMFIFFPYARAEGKVVRAEAGWGKCRAGSPDEGTWHQRELAHKVQLSDQCGEAGLVWQINKQFHFGARFVNFGQYAVSSIANNDPDDKADLRGSVSNDHTRAECQTQGTTNPGNPLKADCHYRWNGSGHLYGGLFNMAWYPLQYGDFKIGPEVGMVIYRATWRMVIEPTSGAWQYQYDQRTGWQKAPAFGVSAYYKWVYSAYRVYMIPDGAPITPGYRSPIRQLVIGASIPFDL